MKTTAVILPADSIEQELDLKYVINNTGVYKARDYDKHYFITITGAGEFKMTLLITGERILVLQPDSWKNEKFYKMNKQIVLTFQNE